jgi:RNA polymerase sigma-70 factor (ECF subfamily)
MSQTVTNRSDDELMASIQRKDVRALEEFYDRYRAMAYALALRVLGTPSDAEDVVQEAYLNLWRSAGGYHSERSTPRSWLLSIVHHRSIDKLRSRQSRPQQAALEDDAPLPADTDVWREVSRTLTGEQVRSALDQLPTEQRETIELAYFSGYSQSQIADLMKVPLGTVKGRIRIGLHRLKAILEGSEGGLVPE